MIYYRLRKVQCKSPKIEKDLENGEKDPKDWNFKLLKGESS